MRSLYFDIDGTILIQSTGEAKSALARGRLEQAVRRTTIGELVCVGNFVSVIHTMQSVNHGYDGLGAIFALAQGVFQDESWFRSITRIGRDPKNRALEFPLKSDWWYMDDLAKEYMQEAGLGSVFERENGRRILVPSDEGDGGDVIAWLDRLAAA